MKSVTLNKIPKPKVEVDNNPRTNLNLKIFEISDEQYSLLKEKFGKEITRAAAIKIVNDVRAFKRDQKNK